MNNIELQKKYYEQDLLKPSIQPVKSLYVNFHINKIIAAAGLSTEKSTVEIGSGLGKFTIPLLELGYSLTCLDISPIMLELLQEKSLPYNIDTIVSDIACADKNTDRRFQQAIGFFTLHHMSDLQSSFNGLYNILLPNAIVAFCEPIAYNPLYYLQIALTPGMKWSAEKGIINMKRSYLFTVAKKAGFKSIGHATYGFFPPLLMNHIWGYRINNIMEQQQWLSFAHAFQIFVMQRS